MHIRKSNMPLRVVAGLIVLAAAGLASALPASAAPAPATRTAAITTVIDTDFAGYLTGGDWRYRYISADVTMAPCRPVANQNALAQIALRSNIFDEKAHIDLRCGGGSGSVMFGTVSQAEGHFQLSPSVGDVLRISVFRNVAACRDEFTATNLMTHNTKMVTVATTCQVIYRHAQPGATLTDISGTWSPPPTDIPLWQFHNVAITSYNGTHGTICGPWPSEMHLAAPVIAIRLIPSAPQDSCHSFKILLKGAS